jgi:hypothetical protein
VDALDLAVEIRRRQEEAVSTGFGPYLYRDAGYVIARHISYMRNHKAHGRLRAFLQTHTVPVDFKGLVDSRRDIDPPPPYNSDQAIAERVSLFESIRKYRSEFLQLFTELLVASLILDRR